MYFPLLRGKQFELIALKEFAGTHPENKWVFPIIEPVRVMQPSHIKSSLMKAAEVLSQNRIPYSIILNPERGDYAISSNRLTVADFLNMFKELENRPIPAFFAGGKSMDVINAIDENGLEDVMVVFEDSFDIEEAGELCSNKAVSYIVCGDADSRSNMRFLMRTGKKIIRLDDKFIVRKPNTEYRGRDEDSYTEEFFYYKEDKFYGFSDYCVLPKEFSEGGGTPTAIAIHMTYRKKQDSVWVRHFVSDETYDTQNIRNKFGSAVKHLEDFYNTVEPTEAARWMIENRGKYPGLGVLKKITMLNHLELISNILPTIK